MSDDVARAVGAGSAEITIAGKQCKVRPLSLRELTELQRECLRQYKKEYLRTIHESLEFLPKGERTATMDRKIGEAARWDIDDLPTKWAYDADDIALVEKLVNWLGTEYDLKDDDLGNEKRLRQLAVTALDRGTLTLEKYKEFAEKPPRRVKIDYASWWVTGPMDGMIAFVWVCFKDSGVTKDEIAEEIGKNPAIMAEISREIESLSAPRSDFGSDAT